MRVLVLGASGVMGIPVVDELKRAGHEVTAADLCIDEEPATGQGTRPSRVICDVTDAVNVRAVFDLVQPDVAVHLAALVSFPQISGDPVAALAVNGAGALHVYEAARNSGCARVVLASSKAVYGNIAGSFGPPEFQPVPESFAYRPVNIYDALKCMAEVMGQVAARRGDFEFTALRFGTIVGPGKQVRHGNSSIFSRIVEAAWAGDPVSIERGATQVDDLVYVRDCVQAVRLSVEVARLESLAYNVARGELVSVNQFAEAVRHAIPQAQISVGPGDNWNGGSTSYRAVLDIERARSELGFSPRYDVPAMVDDYVSWLATS